MTSPREKLFTEGKVAFSPDQKADRSCPYRSKQNQRDWLDGWIDAEKRYSKPEEQTPTWQDQPTENGYYWVADPDFINKRIMEVKSNILGNQIAYRYDGLNVLVDLLNAKWYGPINPPKED